MIVTFKLYDHAVIMEDGGPVQCQDERTRYFLERLMAVNARQPEDPSPIIAVLDLLGDDAKDLIYEPDNTIY